MGYTHYWYRVPKLDKKIFKLAVADCKKICEVLSIPLGDARGEGEPVFNDDKVCFNGNVVSKGFRTDEGIIPWPTDDAKSFATMDDPASREGSWFAESFLNSRSVNEDEDGSYETFAILQTTKPHEWCRIEAKLIFDFCKTAFRPYDLNVQCCLLVFKHHFPKDFFIDSDGKQDQWQEVIDFCLIHLGYLDDFNLDADKKAKEAREKELPALKKPKPRGTNKVPKRKKFPLLKTDGLDISI